MPWKVRNAINISRLFLFIYKTYKAKTLIFYIYSETNVIFKNVFMSEDWNIISEERPNKQTKDCKLLESAILITVDPVTLSFLSTAFILNI